jgi:FMN phosphatase YigB (HAD superfamily)
MTAPVTAAATPAIESLRPRFLPDPDSAREWGEKGAGLARLIRKGFAVPPSAAMGLTQVRGWLESMPEFAPAVEAWSTGSPGRETAREALVQAILGAPMPAHWPLSAGTLRKFLCGDPADEPLKEGEETWPLVLRSSVLIEDLIEPVTVRMTTAENLWKGLLQVVASAFRESSLKNLLLAGVDPRAFHFGVLIQPELMAEISGLSYSDGRVEWVRGARGDLKAGDARFSRRSYREGRPPELAAFWERLRARTRKAEKALGRPIALEWLWDGEQLWFMQARPSAPSSDASAASKAPWRSSPVKTLLVDLDGTLLGAYEPLARAEFILRGLWRLRRHGGIRSAARGLKAVTLAVEKPIAEEQVFLNAERGARAFARTSGLSIEEAGRVLKDEVGAIFPALERYFFPIQGAREFIEWARPRYKLILATNPVWPIEQVKLRLRWSGIDPEAFASITHSERMHACKPSAAYYREILEQEGLEASECALVGDDVTRDLPATRVGISVFILHQPKFAGMGARRIRTAVSSHGGIAQAAAGTYQDFRDLLIQAGSASRA